jgi:light-regulated signal transduction histidine kinase (bacteriophytochrome)/ActR/RegA family two-component response regulator
MNNVDLSNCDREPIHIPGSIQPHGVLTACVGEALTIVQVSANVDTFFGAPPADVLGTTLASWLAPESSALLHEAREALFPRERNPLSLVSRQGRAFDAIGHRSGDGLTIVEFEPQQHHERGFDIRMRSSIRRLQDATTRQALLETAAREVRSLTGFDRVMVYEFDPDWHGHVVAEAKRDDLEPFLRLHYPASDIPAQARHLYSLNWLRIIPDVAYVPAPLVASLSRSDQTPLDLSFAVLRSVSPIHIEYLRNMGVTASMSVSLVHHGTLLGLIACHHYSGPHYVSFVTRETAEYLGQVLSWHVTALDAQEIAKNELATQRAKAALVSVLDSADSIVEGLSGTTILELTGATGAAIVYDKHVHRVGACPDEAFVRTLIPLLADATRDGTLATDHLAEMLPDASPWDDVAAGVLAVAISRDLDEYVIWFRPATERTVDWAGDPRKDATVNVATDAPRLSPRGSFALWRETVRGRAVPWERWHVTAASELRNLLLGRIRKRGAELQHLNQQLAAADRAKDEFVATVSHELRTPLNAILGWVQMLQAEGVPRERQLRALTTVERNARSQAKLIEDLLDVSRMLSGTLRLSVEPVNVGAVVEQIIESVRLAAEAKDIRLQTVLDSTASVLGDQQRLQQVVSNLLSNALKFTPKHGKVQVAVERLASSVEISVADSGQGIEPDFLPRIFERFQQADAATTRRSSGLGLGLAIVKHIVELHGGTVEAFSAGAAKGSTFTVRLPLSIAARATVPTAVDVPAGSLPCPPELNGVRLLIVDDDVDARELLQELFTRCHASVCVADSVAEGLAALRRERPDVLISDIGMPDEDGYALIARVRALPASEGGRTPAIALTAYARAEDRARVLLAGFQNHLAKPVEPLEILAVVASLVSMRST